MKITKDKVDRVIEIVKLAPNVGEIIRQAAETTNVKGYHRIRTYRNLRDQAVHLVGWDARRKALQTQQAYHDVITLISFLLPPDDVDIWSEGEGNCEPEDHSEWQSQCDEVCQWLSEVLI